MRISFGIDFGTKNSALAINRDSKVEVANINPTQTGNGTIISAVYFDPDDSVFIGQEGIDEYIINGHEGRLFQAVKSLLKNEEKGFYVINKKLYSLEGLIGIILRKIKQRGEAIVKETVENVVLGRPVIFSKDATKNSEAKEKLEKAALLAGFKRVTFMFEPVAAALAFKQSEKNKQEQIIMVCDVGAGTSDFSIIKIPAISDVSKIDQSSVLSLGGLYIGGDDFDSDIMLAKLLDYYGASTHFRGYTDQWNPMPFYIYKNLVKWHLVSDFFGSKTRDKLRQIRARSDDPVSLERLEDLIDGKYGYQLFQQIEKTKIALSFNKEAQIIFREGLSNISEVITRNDFEKIIENHLREIRLCADKTVNDAGISKSTIDRVFLTGGSSQIPAVKNIFNDMFGIEKIVQNDVLTAVVRGLGIYAGFL